MGAHSQRREGAAQTASRPATRWCEQGEAEATCSCFWTARSTWRSTAGRSAQVGPGAIVGERAVLEGGERTATLRAATPGRVAMIPPEDVDESALTELARAHRAEQE